MNLCSIERRIDLNGKKKLPLSSIILCGGNSKRMRRNKAFLSFGGSSLIGHCINVMSNSFAEVILVCNDPDEFQGLSDNVVRDLIPGKGPLEADLTQE